MKVYDRIQRLMTNVAMTTIMVMIAMIWVEAMNLFPFATPSMFYAVIVIGVTAGVVSVAMGAISDSLREKQFRKNCENAKGWEDLPSIDE